MSDEKRLKAEAARLLQSLRKEKRGGGGGGRPRRIEHTGGEGCRCCECRRAKGWSPYKAVVIEGAGVARGGVRLVGGRGTEARVVSVEVPKAEAVGVVPELVPITVGFEGVSWEIPKAVAPVIEEEEPVVVRPVGFEARARAVFEGMMLAEPEMGEDRAMEMARVKVRGEMRAEAAREGGGRSEEDYSQEARRGRKRR